MKFLLITLLMTPLINCTSELNTRHMKEAINTPKFNLDAINSYFIISSKLLNGEKVPDEIWDDYFAIDANKIYIKENGIEHLLPAIRKSMEVVFYKNSTETPEKEQQTNPFVISQKRYKEHYDGIFDYYKQLNTSPKLYLQTMQRLAKRMLPERMHEIKEIPPIYFHALGEPSANKKGLFFDLMVDYDTNQIKFACMAAHELHHQMRESILENVIVEKQDTGVIWALDAILNEGLADLIDKEKLLSNESNWWMKKLYKPVMDESQNAIIQLDRLILNESTGVHSYESVYRSALNNSVGHVPGYCMALKIKQNGKLKQLIEHADNPFMFILLYNQVAITNQKLPQFSTQSINYIKELINKYQIK